MFVDEVTILVQGGGGGNGAVSFRREKFVPEGGPDGGDGGDGGDVILAASRERNTLIDLRYHPRLKAQSGTHGSGQNRHGARGKNLYVHVPVGTVVKDEKGTVLADINVEGLQVVAARGGKGGRGNARFATSRRRAPGFAEKGEPGEQRDLYLELKLLADVGLVGFPNAGKSTLLSRISAARPRIADYPFTTLSPQLGVVSLGEGRSFVVADLPGIIEGAYQGAGLGHKFLRHIERTAVLLFLIDIASVVDGRDPYHDYVNLREELELYGGEVLHKPGVLAANKMDLPGAEEKLVQFRARVGANSIFPISALTGEGIDVLLEELYRIIDEEKPTAAAERTSSEVVYLPALGGRQLSVRKKGDIYVVSGDEVEKAVQKADLDDPEGLRRFQRVMDRLGVEQELLKAGIKEGDTVRIGEVEFTYYLS